MEIQATLKIKFGELWGSFRSCPWITCKQSHCRSLAGRYFYETENVLWAGFGPVGNTEKIKCWADYEQLLRTFFYVIIGKKNV
jgi:hypothetical protein